ncbi:MAG: hypothetical protein BIP78_0366 [Candidatus Bipolaricaulis sibiricus]|uniref:Uncharacterized protein n=1 Tax=Bipolaricaulis sibiricus TaxID=2501609 RepID=A0A410FT21_BIPS1|nr:MAG: hypothetical protein BIP78_0366 [Candidatus Bipolaricaulis sibiricus]
MPQAQRPPWPVREVVRALFSRADCPSQDSVVGKRRSLRAVTPVAGCCTRCRSWVVTLGRA